MTGRPREFDGYRLVRLLGRGAMGEVYLAQDTLLERPVAIKFISAAEADEQTRRRFLVEARAIARLQHPNVVSIYRVGEAGGDPYLVSEFIRGKSLDRLETPIDWRKALRIGLDVARALSVAHHRGVVHRDIKPANAILSSDGEVKLLDFGIAKLLEPAGGTVSLAPDPLTRQSVPSPFASTRFASGAPSATEAAVRRLSVRPPDSGRFESAFGSTPEGMDAALAATARAVDPLAATAPGADPLAGTVADAFGATAYARRSDPLLLALAAADAARAHAPLSELKAPSIAFSEGAFSEGALSEAPVTDLTVPGTVMGTPSFMAPEVWCSEPATFASDVYSLGAMLFALCAGRPPHLATNLAMLATMVTEVDAEPLARVAPEVDRAFAAVVDRCLARDPAARYPNGDALQGALLQLTPDARGAAVPEGNPYRGLYAFDAAHSALYFGRDAEIRATLERLATDAFVLVAGDSGVGKSSLCRAGVLPRLGEGLDPKRTWSVATLVPGRHPVAALAAAIAPHLGLGEDEAARRLIDQAPALARELRRGQGEDRGIVLFIDQLEELVTLSVPAEADAVAEVLGWLTSPTPGVRVLATVRGDFLSRLAALQPIGDVMSRALMFLRPLSAERVREAILGPADATGVRFEDDGLVASLVEETVRAEGALPLLQFALAQLWEARDPERRLITQAAYERVGGVSGALTRHADDVLSRLRPSEREAARAIFLRLVTAEGTRARRSEAELTRDDAHARAALDALVRGRLVVARDGRDGEEVEGSVFEIAHEALVHAWKTLAGWLAVDENRRLAIERIGAAAREWRRLGRADDALFGPRQLVEIAAITPDELARDERAFVDASRRAQLRGRLARVAAWVGVPVVLAAVWGGVQVKAAADLRRRVDGELGAARRSAADARALRSELQTLEARAFALFDALDRDGAEKLWAESRKRVDALRVSLGRATQQLEAALVLDRSRADVQGELADLLYDRALLAESLSANGERDELLQRLSLYDANGERQRRWSAPATVSVSTDPPSATVTLERFVGEGGRPRLEPVPVPTGELRLPPGSFRLTLFAPGAPPTRYPFVAARDERLRLAIDLRPAARAPKGFVYVPAGRFFFGSTAEDSLRKGFFHAVPAHLAETAGYFIAARETTFADWIEYLDALPAGERKARFPRLDQGGFSGAVSFKAGKDAGEGYQLTFQPATQAYTVRPGEKVNYPGRTRRAAQDWLRFPVFAVGIADARAYAAWLSASGRVPGARLCSEREWERAARGGDRREYPHGSTLEVDDANIDTTYDKVPTAMGPDETGAHPESVSPFDLHDMAGNVWEWTESSVTAGGIAARGGSYYFDANSARVSHREEPEPSFRDVSVGLRVCADLKAP